MTHPDKTDVDALAMDYLDEEQACSCGAGHGSLEGHLDWCNFSILTAQAAELANLRATNMELVAQVARLTEERDEARRRRDAWAKKAEGYDDVCHALREKVGTPWPPHMSRLLWAGVAAAEKRRADVAFAAGLEAAAKVAEDAAPYTEDAIHRATVNQVMHNLTSVTNSRMARKIAVAIRALKETKP